MTKLMSVAALLLAIGCGGAAPQSAESEEALSNGLCYSQYRECAEGCSPDDSLCLCLCHNALANCTVPKGRLYKCPPDTVNSSKATEPTEAPPAN
jgi:hypothetical protein